ncbi:hypothetical protein [Cryobacterium arcticum]|uniref:hypothetical protein n=1 Tax=Cryobacterium arcticum TaxID=670052 RepID=UPI0012EE102B|nr:hypothetical protein [Cryobacterium arcticum]
MATAVLTMLLTGCAAADQEDSMTPYEAQDTLVVLFDRIQTEVGGDWENQDDPSPMSCDVRGGGDGDGDGDGDGVQFTATRMSVYPRTMDEAKAATAAVTALLTDEGYEILESGLFGEEGYDLTMTNNKGSNINFGGNDVAMGLNGGSDCRPGDFDQILDELRSQEK